MDFDMLGLAPRLVETLARQGIKTPTPIQTQAIPHAMNRRDVLGLAQTGTGRSVALHDLWNRRHTTKFNGVSYPVQRAARSVRPVAR